MENNDKIQPQVFYQIEKDTKIKNLREYLNRKSKSNTNSIDIFLNAGGNSSYLSNKYFLLI